MKLSTRSRYGVRLMLRLALHYGEGPVFLKRIANQEDISEKYASQIIIPLRGVGLVHSSRGAHGGYMLARAPARISVKEIVEVLEGNLSLVDCVKNPSVCSRVPRCAVRDIWRDIEEHIAGVLAAITLADLVITHRDKNTGGPDENNGQ